MLFLLFSLRRTFIQRSRYRLSTIPELTAMDRLLRLKPMVTDDYDDNIHEDIDENDSDFTDGDPDPFHRLGRHLLKLGKISYRKIDFLPDWIEERQREVYSHRTQSQIRRCIKNWMLRPNKDLMPIYLQRPLGWKKMSENDRIREIYAYGPEETVAYSFFFFPARFAINSRIMREIKALLPEFCPTKVIDFGCGPGTSGLAAKEVWGELLKKYVGVDLSKSMLDAAKILLQTRGNATGNSNNTGTGIRNNEKRNNYRGGFKNKHDEQFENEVDYSSMGIADCSFWEKSADVIQRAGETGERYNLAIISYVLTDLNSDAARLAATQLVFELLEEGGLMVIIDAGNPMGSHAVRTARQYLLDTFNSVDSNPNIEKSFVLPPPAPYSSYTELGATVVAPCTHDKPCPLSLGHWCSFSQKVKSGIIRKGSEEKFSYVIIRKSSKKNPLTAANDTKKYYSSPAQVANEWTKEKTGKNVSIIPSSNVQNRLPHRWTAPSPGVDYHSLSTDDIISKHARPTPLLHMLIREEQGGGDDEEVEEEVGNSLFDQVGDEEGEEDEDEVAQWLALEKDLEQKIDQEEKEGKGIFGMDSNRRNNNNNEDYDEEEDFEDGDEEDDDEGVFIGNKKRSKVVAKLIDHVDWDDYTPDLYRSEWSRILRSPLKANRHITLDVCAPTGQLIRSTYSKGSIESIPSLFSALRKSSWGGLFPALDLNDGMTQYNKKSYLATSRGGLGYNKSTGKSRNKLQKTVSSKAPVRAASTPEDKNGAKSGRDLSHIDSFDTFRADSNLPKASKKIWTKKTVTSEDIVNNPVSNTQTSVMQKVPLESATVTTAAKGKGGGRRKPNFMDTSKLMEAHRIRRSIIEGKSHHSSNE